MNLNSKSQALYDAMWKMPPDYDEIRQIIEQNELSTDEISLTAVKFIEDAFIEEADYIGPENNKPDEPVIITDFHSANLYSLMKLLIEYGLDSNKEYEECSSVIRNLFYIGNEYVSADTLILLLENGGKTDSIVDGQRIIDDIDFDIIFDKYEQRDRRRYDAQVHYWLVMIGFGALLKSGKVPVDIVDKPYITEDFGIKCFEISDLKNHRNYTFGISYLPSKGEDYTIHIFDKRTKCEVARL